MDARELGAALSQSALDRLSGDDPWRQPLDAWRQLDAQCRRAASGQGDDDGFNALTARF
jgi:hypothetical protein